ncbi:ABC transporter permease [Lentibacillus sp. N15]|uniref:ABC transporter permease n=1 Tax=Lentibacillus songyuanensis TaxID=3136161 RepID=UPI0031BB20B8
MNAQRVQAIFEKDIKDFMKNTMVLFTPILPIVMAILYSRMGEGTDEEMPMMIIYIVVGVTYSAVAAGCMMMLMAEENEKKTLRGLILSPASFMDIIIGKSLVTTLLTVVSLAISLLIMGIEPLLHVQTIIGLVLLFLFFLFLGIGVGLFVKSVGITTAYLMPIMFLFGFTPMIELLGFADDSLTMKIASYFPIPQLIDMHETHSWMPIVVVAIWTLAAALFTIVCFKNVKRDE